MDDDKVSKILGYLCSKLSDDDRDELKTLLGGEQDAPDLAEDVRTGKIAMDRAPAHIRRRVVAQARTAPDLAGFAERFPGAANVRTA